MYWPQRVYRTSKSEPFLALLFVFALLHCVIPVIAQPVITSSQALYASPSGTGTSCTLVVPCTLDTALLKAHHVPFYLSFPLFHYFPPFSSFSLSISSFWPILIHTTSSSSSFSLLFPSSHIAIQVTNFVNTTVFLARGTHSFGAKVSAPSAALILAPQVSQGYELQVCWRKS